MYTNTLTHLYTLIYTYTHTYLYTLIHIHTHILTHLYILIYTYTLIHLNLHLSYDKSLADEGDANNQVQCKHTLTTNRTGQSLNGE